MAQIYRSLDECIPVVGSREEAIVLGTGPRALQDLLDCRWKDLFPLYKMHNLICCWDWRSWSGICRIFQGCLQYTVLGHGGNSKRLMAPWPSIGQVVGKMIEEAEFFLPHISN
jgi:hypothetical protein